MILGLGTDIIEIERLAKTLERAEETFLRHVFTTTEIAGAPTNHKLRCAYFAARWAAKEALAKALGTGIGRDCAWRDIEISNNAAGKPALALTGSAAATAAKLGIGRLHLSLSHERCYACATVIAESAEGQQQLPAEDEA